VDALVLAKAGLKRLNLLDHWTCTDIPLDLMLPAVCQGIVTLVGCRDNAIFSQLWGAEMNHHSSAVAAAAERAFLDVVDQFLYFYGNKACQTGFKNSKISIR
jgi:porphobilinogen deaminase